MKKVIVIGCPGGGKSTFARTLHEKTGLPLYYLDMMYWRADRTTAPKAEFRENLRKILEQERWIVDGNYGSTMEARLEKCDTVFFLDYPTEICVEGVMRRRGKPRPDMPWVESADSVDEDFINFVKNYRIDSRPKVLELLKKYSDRDVHVFRDREEASAYLNSI